jgi:glyoxylase-like metal-dependent hydrolase (beta-lactamase superfamily II)
MPTPVDANSAPVTEPLFPGYVWQRVADGVYLHGASDPLAGPVDGNSVVIVGTHGVAVIDTHVNPAATRAALAKIGTLTDKPVTHVVNTHWHDDHTNGNYVYRDAFPAVKIVSHAATLEALKREWAPMEEQRRQGYEALAPDDLMARADTIDDPVKAAGYRVFAGYVAALKPELPTLRLEYPDTVFDAEYRVDLGGRELVLKWLGRGNTEGDIVAWLPGDGILVTGDLLVAPVPFAFDSPMVDWVETLDRLAAIDARIIIPGHGPAQFDATHLHRVRALLQTTIDKVRKAHGEGVAYGDLGRAVDLRAERSVFAGDDAAHEFAWHSYFVDPGLKSAWQALGYAVPEDE